VKPLTVGTKETETRDLKIGTVQKLVEDATKKLSFDGIKELVKSWNRCVEVEVDYVQK
jgi:hypothetical protein